MNEMTSRADARKGLQRLLLEVFAPESLEEKETAEVEEGEEAGIEEEKPAEVYEE